MFRKQLTEKSSVLEAIQFWTGSIKAYTADKATGKDFSHAPVIVIGTHKDKVKKKNVDSIFNKIRIAMQIDSLPCIAIDNTLKCATDADLHKIRDKIIDDGIGILDREFKASWIDLEYSLLQEKDKGVILLTFKELQIIDKKSDMPIREQADLRSFLEYQHCNGFLMYYQTHKDLIILEPTILVTIINELLRRRAKDQKAKSHAMKTNAGWCSDGMFDRNYIVGAVKKESKSVTHSIDVILELLKHLKIVYPMDTKETNKSYFMPCLLPTKPDNELIASQKEGSKSPKIKYIFDNQAIPPAFFHSLTASLLSVWTPTNNNEVMEIYNLYVCFCLRGDTSVLEMYWTESSIIISIINYSDKRSLMDLNCRSIIETVKQHIYTVLQTYRHIQVNCTAYLCCPKHTSAYIKLDTLMKEGGTMCYRKTGRHLVTAETAFKDWFFDIKCLPEKGRSKRHLPKCITEQMLGRLALALSRDDPISLANKLQCSYPWNVAHIALSSSNNDTPAAKFRVLLKWKQENPTAEQCDMLEILTRCHEYTMEELEIALLESVPLRKYDLSKIDLDNNPTEKQCDVISQFVDTKFLFLFLELGLTDSTVMQERHNGKEQLEATRTLLIKWTHDNPESAKLRTVLDIASFLSMNTPAMEEKLKVIK